MSGNSGGNGDVWLSTIGVYCPGLARACGALVGCVLLNNNNNNG